MAPTAAITGIALSESLPMSARRPLSGKPDIAADMAVGPLLTHSGHSDVSGFKHLEQPIACKKLEIDSLVPLIGKRDLTRA
jgi:hypothetical protein